MVRGLSLNWAGMQQVDQFGVLPNTFTFHVAHVSQSLEQDRLAKLARSWGLICLRWMGMQWVS